MKAKKIWFYLCITEAALIFAAAVYILPEFLPVKAEEADLSDFLPQFAESNNYVPDAGYIPDAKTAKTVGACIIDNLAGKKGLGSYRVKYDGKNRLWYVSKGYFFFSPGGVVVIEQDTGRVIEAWLEKF